MNQTELKFIAQQQLPKYLSRRFRVGSAIRKNHLREGQRVIALTREKEPFWFTCTILGFADFFDLDRDVCRRENIIPDTFMNEEFYKRIGNPIMEEWDTENKVYRESIFFCRTRDEVACPQGIEPSVHDFTEAYSGRLSDEGFANRVLCEPIMVGYSLRSIAQRHILFMRNEQGDWLAPNRTKLTWFLLESRRSQ